MENKTSFDLEAAIASWRAGLSAHEAIGAEKARELESHLRDGVAGWVAKGLTEAEALEVAAGRLGPAEKLAAEFVKEDGLAVWRARFFWMILGMILLRVLADFGTLTTTVPGVFLVKQFFPAGLPKGDWILAVAVAQVLLSLVALGWMFFAAKRKLARDGGKLDAHFARFCAKKGWLAIILVWMVLMGMILKVSGIAYLARSLGPTEMQPLFAGGVFWALLQPLVLTALAVAAAPRAGLSKIAGAK